MFVIEKTFRKDIKLILICNFFVANCCLYAVNIQSLWQNLYI